MINCPNCETQSAAVFYKAAAVPVNSVIQLDSYEAALNYPKGEIALALCTNCGFVFNAAFDNSLVEYSAKYESTQSFSGTFNKFAHETATRLIDKYDLHDKQIIEIGCGQGEFITQLCELGPNSGVGFDPAYRPEELDSEARDRIEFIADFYGDKYTSYQGDVVACKMTLEHIDKTAAFMRTVRSTVGDNRNTVIFFQIPNARYVFDDFAFWDVYYEHCSYFSMGSVARLFRRTGFDVTHLETVYDDQYIIIEAVPADGPTDACLPEEDDLQTVIDSVKVFTDTVSVRIADWGQQLANAREAGERVVIWGGGSKGVAFLNTVENADHIEYAVDINPRKHGMYMGGTGQRIVAPQFLVEYDPQRVIVMNPIYTAEIQADLDKLGLSAELIPLE